jgi:hypothetical protein
MPPTSRYAFAVWLLVSCAAWLSMSASTANGDIVIMDLPPAIPTLRLVRLGLPPGLRLETTCPKWLPQPRLDPVFSAMPRVPAFGPPGFGRLAPLALSDGLRLGSGPWAGSPGPPLDELWLASEPWRELVELGEHCGAVWELGTTLGGMPARELYPPIRFWGESPAGLTCVPYEAPPPPLFEDLGADAVVSQSYPGPRPAPVFPRIFIRGYSR